MEYRPINLAEKLANFSEHWSPKIIAQMNGYHFKLVKFQGEFVWHDHKDTDEVFIVLDGEMAVHFRDRDVSVKKGELLVIPRGVEHKTSAKAECRAMLVEAVGTVNTGLAGGEKTGQPTPGFEATADPRINTVAQTAGLRLLFLRRLCAFRSRLAKKGNSTCTASIDFRRQRLDDYWDGWWHRA